MMVILLDAVLLLLLLGLTLTGVRALFQRSAFALPLKQIRNRRRIERGGSTPCPEHGAQMPAELVRLPSGETLCPHCDSELYHGQPD